MLHNIFRSLVFISSHFFPGIKGEGEREKLFPVVQILTVKKVSGDEFEGNKNFFVCYLFDVSLMNELYWHLGDIENEYNSFSGVEGQE
jgi:hypothetical protein